jgi:hypothetical protein
MLWSCGKKTSSTTSAQDSNTNPGDPNDPGDSDFDDENLDLDNKQISFQIPTNLGTGTYTNADSNYPLSPKAAFFDASLNSNNQLLGSHIVLTDDANFCVLNANALTTDSWVFTKNSKFLVFKVKNLSETEELPLNVAKYTIDSNKIYEFEYGDSEETKTAGAIADTYYIALDNNCVMKPSFTAASGGALNLTELNVSNILEPTKLSIKGNYDFTIDNTAKSSVKGDFQAYACGGILDAFFSSSESSNFDHGITTDFECK